MERSQSVPAVWSGTGNPWYSDKAQTECLLAANRPLDLPTGDGVDEKPIQNSTSGMGSQPSMQFGVTGKGRGSSMACVPDVEPRKPTVQQQLKSEGVMPGESGEKTMGSVGNPKDDDVNSGGSLQRALEGEIVDLLRQQNSALLEEVANLRRLLEQSAAKADSGVSSSPWSQLGDTASGHSNGTDGKTQKDRQGRSGSRTPRARVRETAISPEKGGRRDPSKYTPNGTRVPDGPPPEVHEDPPVPPLPFLEDAKHAGHDQLQQFSFVSGIQDDLYDTCESKPKAKNGDTKWRPVDERDEILSAREAKQMWLEREVRSLKVALDRVAVPQVVQQSSYWNPNSDGKLQSSFPGPATAVTRLGNSQHDPWALGGSGDPAQQVRAGTFSMRQGEGRGQLLGGSGEGAQQVRASALSMGDPVFRGPSLAGSGDPCLQARACATGTEHRKECHGPEVPHHGRAFAATDGVCGDDRAGIVQRESWGLHDKGPGSFNDHPRHGLGGGGVGAGQDRVYGPWTEGGSMSKLELPDLPESSSPLQFGDWLHLSTPVMKDLSGVADWWWESTLREAKCYYEQWKQSTPLQRIQINPKLPEDLCEHKFQRTEQRGIQMLLKAIPLAEQQTLVTDRALSSTAILYKLLVRFQPGGAGEKQILLQQLTSMPKLTTIQEVAGALRNWRRHYGRAQEVQAVLPDGVLLVKALDTPLQKIAGLDQQAAFRLSQSRMQLQLDEKPEHASLWAFSQCLLAEAETLCLMSTSAATSPQTPLKLKQLQGDAKPPATTSPADTKMKQNATAEKPCRFFSSDAGCRAGKSCRWLHSWEGISDKASRCWSCGSKEHRKAECTVKAASRKTDEPRARRPRGRKGFNFKCDLFHSANLINIVFIFSHGRKSWGSGSQDGENH